MINRRSMTTSNKSENSDDKNTNKNAIENSSNDEVKLTVKKPESQTFRITQIPGRIEKFVRKARGEEDDYDESKEEKRKGPFKNYYEYDERSKKTIMFYEEYFDKNTKEKDRENFMVSKQKQTQWPVINSFIY